MKPHKKSNILVLNTAFFDTSRNISVIKQSAIKKIFRINRAHIMDV